jgi:hypothetical protein
MALYPRAVNEMRMLAEAKFNQAKSDDPKARRPNSKA